MKTFQTQAAQGDVFFRRIDSVPANCIFVEREGDRLIVTHSETGKTIALFRCTQMVLWPK